jgi:hypothetical protein
MGFTDYLKMRVGIEFGRDVGAGFKLLRYF